MTHVINNPDEIETQRRARARADAFALAVAETCPRGGFIFGDGFDDKNTSGVDSDAGNASWAQPPVSFPTFSSTYETEFTSRHSPDRDGYEPCVLRPGWHLHCWRVSVVYACAPDELRAGGVICPVDELLPFAEYVRARCAVPDLDREFNMETSRANLARHFFEWLDATLPFRVVSVSVSADQMPAVTFSR